MESAPAALREIADEVTLGNIEMAELSRFIAAVIPACIESTESRQLFQKLKRHGFHVTPVHFYQPIPDTQSLPDALWNNRSELVGIDMNDSFQLDLLRNHFPKFRREYEQWPTKPTGKSGRFYLRKRPFGGTDALMAYCVVRYFQPRLIIEVGSGYSSLVLAEAVAKTNGCSLTCIEPFSSDFLSKGFPCLKALVARKVEEIELDFFSQLAAGDILFIDSSHMVRLGETSIICFWKCCRASSPE